MQGCSTTGAIRAERIDIINQHDSVDDTINKNKINKNKISKLLMFTCSGSW